MSVNDGELSGVETRDTSFAHSSTALKPPAGECNAFETNRLVRSLFRRIYFEYLTVVVPSVPLNLKGALS